MNLKEKVNKFKKEFKENEDLKIRYFSAFNNEFALLYIDCFSDFDIISKDIIEPIIKYKKENSKESVSSKNIILKENEKQNNLLTFISENILCASEIELNSDFQEQVQKLARGEKILLCESEDNALIIFTKKIEKRTVMEPPTNNVVLGPREGFIEDFNTNLNLIRKRLPTSDLKIENLELGRFTKNRVAICYLTKIADKKIVKKIKKCLEKIDIDGVLDSYYLQDFLEERPNSIFKQIGHTEKPDILVGKMLEGRIGIIVDGSPIALTLPFILMEDLQSSEDYYEDNNKVSFIRILRIFGLTIALIMPGLYISLQLYHYRAFPLQFLVTIINSSQNIPMPPAIEVFFAFFMFEILYEASIRTPKGLGSSFNIIGALILGDTAVKSNLCSAPTIMIVALSSIAIYLLPDATNVMRLLRFALTVIGTLIGLVGIVIGLIFIVGYLNDFDSYGAAYLSPVSPFKKSDFQDFVIKKNIRKIKTRPSSFSNKNRIRLGVKNGKNKEN